MEKKLIALVASSAAAAAVFVGCSCGSAVENSIPDSDTIMMQSDVTVSSASATTTKTAKAETETVLTTGTTMSATNKTEKATTTGTRAIQFVGRSQAQNQVVTVKPQVITQIVVVTVTVPAATTVPVETIEITETTAAVTTEEPLQTVDKPDGFFHQDRDIRFVQDEIEMTVGQAIPSMDSLEAQVTQSTPIYGGTAANIYACEGFDVITEVFAYEDGSTEELIMEIVLTGEKACTTKGVVPGASVDSILAAYGSDSCEITDTNTYRYKAEDGHVLDFCTDGSFVTEIRYYQASE
ncbi:MAG: hypothetical protein IJ496_01070 [Ruminococcus sp.]|nr:hypothetical protein [Ruminococcus sp.]